MLFSYLVIWACYDSLVLHSPISSILSFPETNLKTIYNYLIQIMRQFFWQPFSFLVILQQRNFCLEKAWSSLDTLCPRLKTFLMLLQSYFTKVLRKLMSNILINKCGGRQHSIHGNNMCFGAMNIFRIQVLILVFTCPHFIGQKP